MDNSLFQGQLVTSRRIIYTPSDFARTNLIHLQEIGSLQALRPHTSQRENLSSYLVFLVLEGSGTLSYQNRSFPLSKGDCVFLDCRKPYSHRSSDNLWQLKWAHFYGPNLNGIYDKYTQRGGRPCFHAHDPASFENTLDELYSIADSSSYIKDMKIYEKLSSLLTLLMEESWNPDLTRKQHAKKQNLQNIKDYIDSHYQEKITLDTLSEQFFINKYYLTRVFKEQFGVPVVSYLIQVRITHAKRLLRFTDHSIERIGQECGIGDANYFTRIFRKVEGVTPGEYRRMW